MNQILHWLPEQMKLPYPNLHVSLSNMVFFMPYRGFVKLVQSRWLDISLDCFGGVYGPIDCVSA